MNRSASASRQDEVCRPKCGKHTPPITSGKRGKLGGKARADAPTPEQRKEIAKKAAVARWGKADKKR